ncbi:MAG TPA: class I SAM-dependent methyltransferase [Polyangiaceae bacterium]|jgi:SAM-dependent methyltransferase|nr:class I SAM-dependent methyltransferase [Polyangiaceae bacterium]
MHREAGFPLDYHSTGYAYLERPNRVLIDLLERHVLRERPSARILDVGCGVGANGRRIRELAPEARIVGIEPNERAATLARHALDEVFEGTLEAWAKTAEDARFDAVLLSDVLEHSAEPVAFLRQLSELPSVRQATFVVSVPNYGVWYNRVRTLFGRFEYSWSGLYDRTHLRFFTRRSLKKLLDYTGFSLIAEACTPSVVQSAAPILRRFFECEVDNGDHLALADSRAFGAYERFVEPLEARACRVWPELLGFQIVCVAKCV